MARDGLRAAAVAVDAAWLNDAVESVVLVLIAGGKIPARGLRVIGERSLKKIIAAGEKRAKSVLAGADDPAHVKCAAENFLAVCSGFELALDKFAVLGFDFEAVI